MAGISLYPALLLSAVSVFVAGNLKFLEKEPDYDNGNSIPLKSTSVPLKSTSVPLKSTSVPLIDAKSHNRKYEGCFHGFDAEDAHLCDGKDDNRQERTRQLLEMTPHNECLCTSYANVSESVVAVENKTNGTPTEPTGTNRISEGKEENSYSQIVKNYRIIVNTQIAEENCISIKFYKTGEESRPNRLRWFLLAGAFGALVLLLTPVCFIARRVHSKDQRTESYIEPGSLEDGQDYEPPQRYDSLRSDLLDLDSLHYQQLYDNASGDDATVMTADDKLERRKKPIHIVIGSSKIIFNVPKPGEQNAKHGQADVKIRGDIRDLNAT